MRAALWRLMVSSENDEHGKVEPQYQMFDESPNEDDIGSIRYEGDDWAVVLQSRECSDRLFRGRFVFRSLGRELKSVDLFVEPSYEEVLGRATNFEQHLLHDLIRSLL